MHAWKGLVKVLICCVAGVEADDRGGSASNAAAPHHRGPRDRHRPRQAPPAPRLAHPPGVAEAAAALSDVQQAAMPQGSNDVIDGDDGWPEESDVSDRREGSTRAEARGGHGQGSRQLPAPAAPLPSEAPPERGSPEAASGGLGADSGQVGGSGVLMRGGEAVGAAEDQWIPPNVGRGGGSVASWQAVAVAGREAGGSEEAEEATVGGGGTFSEVEGPRQAGDGGADDAEEAQGPRRLQRQPSPPPPPVLPPAGHLAQVARVGREPASPDYDGDGGGAGAEVEPEASVGEADWGSALAFGEASVPSRCGDRGGGRSDWNGSRHPHRDKRRREATEATSVLPSARGTAGQGEAAGIVAVSRVVPPSARGRAAATTVPPTASTAAPAGSGATRGGSTPPAPSAPAGMLAWRGVTAAATAAAGISGQEASSGPSSVGFCRPNRVAGRGVAHTPVHTSAAAGAAVSAGDAAERMQMPVASTASGPGTNAGRSGAGRGRVPASAVGQAGGGAYLGGGDSSILGSEAGFGGGTAAAAAASGGEGGGGGYGASHHGAAGGFGAVQSSGAAIVVDGSGSDSEGEVVQQQRRG